MAQQRNGNAYRVTGAGTESISNPVSICGVKFIPDGGGGTIKVRKSGGTADTDNIYEIASTTSQIFEEVDIRHATGIEVVVTGSNSIVYLYNRF